MLELDQATLEELGYGQNGVDRGECEGYAYRPKKSKQYIPAFAANDRQLQAVILHASVKYCFRNKPIPPDFVPDLETIVRLAKERHADDRAKVDNSQKLLEQRIYRNIVAVEQCGGYVSMIAAVAFRAWRLLWPNSVIADELGMTHEAVEGVGQMLIAYAEELGFETYQHPAHRGRVKVDVDTIAAMFVQGHNVQSIRRILGHDEETIRRALKKAGLFKPPIRADEETVITMWNDGKRLTQIRDATGHTVATITRLLKRRGLYVADRFWKEFLGRDRSYEHKNGPAVGESAGPLLQPH